jgi:hypothetical protein
MSNSAMPSTIARAQQVRRSGNFDLACDADTAFPFFSPEGERDWVGGWDPKPVFPDQIEFDRDTVFREGALEALWTIVDVNWPTHRAEYLRLAPGSHSAHIIVQVESSEAGRSLVTVSYAVTAFGDDQARLLQTFSEDAYAAKMCDWKKRISDCLADRKTRS